MTVLVGLVGLGLVVERWATLPTGGGDVGWFAYGPADGTPVFRSTPGIGLWLAGVALVVQLVGGLLALRRGTRAAA